jgi:hypothetical protein
MRMLSIRISSLRVCSACASETKCGLAPLKINISNRLIFLPPNHLPRKTLWCKNLENPSDRISHTWAPLRTTFYVYSPPQPLPTCSWSCEAVHILSPRYTTTRCHSRSFIPPPPPPPPNPSQGLRINSVVIFYLHIKGCIDSNCIFEKTVIYKHLFAFAKRKKRDLLPN